MYDIHLWVRRVLVAMLAAPVVTLAVYVTWLVVPVVIREVVPEVVRAVLER